MLKSEEILDQFKKSLTATTKSISKNNLVEIIFTKENSSIEGNFINLQEPNIESLKKNSVDLYSAQKSLYLQNQKKKINNSDSSEDDDWGNLEK